MLKNFLTIAWRQLRRNRLFSTVNILGLALGMSCCFLIFFFVRYEHSYDRFHPGVDRLFRVNYLAKFSSRELELSRIPAPIGPELAGYFPEVEAAARLYPRSISATLTDAAPDRSPRRSPADHEPANPARHPHQPRRGPA